MIKSQKTKENYSLMPFFSPQRFRRSTDSNNRKKHAVNAGRLHLVAIMEGCLSGSIAKGKVRSNHAFFSAVHATGYRLQRHTYYQYYTGQYLYLPCEYIIAALIFSELNPSEAYLLGLDSAKALLAKYADKIDANWELYCKSIEAYNKLK